MAERFVGGLKRSFRQAAPSVVRLVRVTRVDDVGAARLAAHAAVPVGPIGMHAVLDPFEFRLPPPLR